MSRDLGWILVQVWRSFGATLAQTGRQKQKSAQSQRRFGAALAQLWRNHARHPD